MPLTPRTRFEWQLRTLSIALGVETKIMGILNVTPDSFSDGGRFVVVEAAMERALEMLDEGAHILDVGGESTRPNAVPISADEEQARVLPVIEAILMERTDAVISIDTFHAATARRAVAAGAEIVNDVSGFTWDSAMAQICGEMGCGVVLMHTRGRSQQWASLPAIAKDDVVPMVLTGLGESILAAQMAGVANDRIVVDPGFGFGKKCDENYSLLAGLEELRQLGLPVLSGTSRKGFLGASLKHLYDGEPAPLSERVNATTAANVASVLAGAHILRVHDVRAAVESAAIADAILAAAAVVAG
ncbi:dihydropteroate synthase [Granulicella aggregans]|uniref:Dihydropteroate synthase n=1 Tax=Granulicella aggregans TaxID=474949 RepID=A0A7W8E4G1_9BACT|nr:dihydropteroate synthase [Granulicella aggregans]MBB5057110.1 dihydropteroate synthase [Granulicella aggregans]